MQKEDNTHGIGGSYVIGADGRRRRSDEPAEHEEAAVQVEPTAEATETVAATALPDAGEDATTAESTDSGSSKATRNKRT